MRYERKKTALFGNRSDGQDDRSTLARFPTKRSPEKQIAAAAATEETRLALAAKINIGTFPAPR
jgi:hypothetical protein